MRGVVVVNGYYKSESESYRFRRLQESFAARGVELFLYENNIPYSEKSFSDTDFCIFCDKDVYLSRLIEKAGVRVFNRSDVLERTDGKLATYVFLTGEKEVKMPATVPAPKKYFYVRDRSFLDAVGEKLGFPVVVKESFGSLGKQVYLAKDREELYRIDEETGTAEKLFQAYHSGGYGQSVRVICIGNRPIGAMKLTSEGDFKSNAFQGGKGEKFELTPAYSRAASRVAEALGADYCGIDFFADEPTLIEVNGNAYFSEFEKVTGADVAGAFADHILAILSPRDGIR